MQGGCLTGARNKRALNITRCRTLHLRLGYKEGWSQRRESTQQKWDRHLLPRPSPSPEVGALAGTWREGNSVHCGWDCGSARPPHKPAWRVLENYEDSCQGPSKSTLGAQPKGTKTRVRRRQHARVHAAPAVTATTRKPPRRLAPGEGGACT